MAVRSNVMHIVSAVLVHSGGGTQGCTAGTIETINVGQWPLWTVIDDNGMSAGTLARLSGSRTGVRSVGRRSPARATMTSSSLVSVAFRAWSPMRRPRRTR